jgi:hypothetical protein
MEDNAAITMSSAIASLRFANGRTIRFQERLVLGELGGGGGGGNDEGRLVEGWGLSSCDEEPTKSGA